MTFDDSRRKGKIRRHTHASSYGFMCFRRRANVMDPLCKGKVLMFITQQQRNVLVGLVALCCDAWLELFGLFFMFRSVAASNFDSKLEDNLYLQIVLFLV